MSSRSVTATAKCAGHAMTLRALLAIKQRREIALRRQLAQQRSQLRQLEQDIYTCSTHRALLAEKRNAWLGWSGTRISDELLAHKQTLMALRDEDQQWMANQIALSEEQRAVLAQQYAIRQALNVVMKKKEKLHSVLNDTGCRR
ncbi:hypothetical protein J5069_13135 [Candidatus Symbiopectobacterium sp. NZEC127]|uniref:hypothetical protein n=1 Tax=Candidatus Symbiopectobacterium sp. NZEC127 TaxID=2820472 RepID=UPI002226AB3B|nr:hypothetical protein [Candidatus Symbiopectobacterium sp. NZEC127]MCW2486837.1 hypothetical protein [Candidatus Symbiopectobacterium sp. NZEC127]